VSHADVPIHLAATVVILRDRPAGLEVLLVQRASELVFHGGAWVFPGGRVDPADEVAGDPEATARRAAVREAAEEAGVRLDARALVAISHWTTPVGRPRRFATWFFATELHAESDVVVDGGEIRAHRWLSPDDALRAHRSGELELPPPTFVTLSVLAQFPHTAGALSHFGERAPIVYVPRQLDVEGGVLSLYHGDVAYEAGDPARAGPRHRLSMFESGWHYECSSEVC
jgi:8-oxo-dGTP pyrophosphatase MutT (NUDIX family)